MPAIVFINKLLALKEILRRCERDKNGCLIYKGDIGTSGYGNITIDRTKFKVHRLILHIMKDMPIGSELQALHKNVCKSRACCEYDHLYIGTPEENTRDLMEAGFKPFHRAAENRRNQTHCKHGHEYTKANTRMDIYGRRHCRECRKAYYVTKE